MTRSISTGPESDPETPTLTRGARARRALILRRAANRTSRRILRSLGGEPPPPSGSAAEAFDLAAAGRIAGPLGSPVQPDEALDAGRNRWGGRL